MKPIRLLAGAAWARRSRLDKNGRVKIAPPAPRSNARRPRPGWFIIAPLPSLGGCSRALAERRRLHEGEESLLEITVGFRDAHDRLEVGHVGADFETAQRKPHPLPREACLDRVESRDHVRQLPCP